MKEKEELKEPIFLLAFANVSGDYCLEATKFVKVADRLKLWEEIVLCTKGKGHSTRKTVVAGTGIWEREALLTSTALIFFPIWLMWD